jgi:transposase
MKKFNAVTACKVVGLDLGDRHSQLVVLEGKSGEVIETGRVRTTPAALGDCFGSRKALRIVIEVGTHSPWVERLLRAAGHEVLVANPRKVRLISHNHRKSDSTDAEYLARLGRLDPRLLSPVEHRDVEAQADLARLRSRHTLVRARTQLINHVRGAVKSAGARIPTCNANVFGSRAEASIPEAFGPALLPILAVITRLTDDIRGAEKDLEELIRTKRPEAQLLLQVDGVGIITALTYLFVVQRPQRFTNSRTVGAYLGLVPARHASGASDPQRRISKEGDEKLRQLLVGCAQHILGPFGRDSDLRRFGERIASRGGKIGKKRAVVAVARKLSVLLHRLWLHGEVYQPLYSEEQVAP